MVVHTRIPGRWSLLIARPLRGHPVRSIVVAVLFGAVGTFAALTVVVRESIVQSIDAQTESLAGEADLVVRSYGPAGFDASVESTVARQDGVAVAASLLEGRATVLGRPVLVLGVSPEAAALGSAGPPAGAGGVPAAAGVWVGSRLVTDAVTPLPGGDARITAALDGVVTELRVAGSLDRTALAGVNGGDVMAGSLPAVQELLHRPGTVTHVLVRARPDVDRDRLRRDLAIVLPDLHVADADAEATSLAANLDVLAEVIPLLSAALIALAVTIAFAIVANLAAAGGHSAAVARALGAPARVVDRCFAAQVAVLALAGAVPGVAAGARLGAGVIDSLPSAATSTLIGGVRTAAPLGVLSGCVAVTVVLSVVLAFLARRAATRLDVMAALRADATGAELRPWPRPRWWLAAGAGALLGGLAGLVEGEANFTSAAVVLVIGGWLLVTVAACGPAAGALAAMLRRAGAVGRVAADAVAGAPRRVWTVTTIVAGTMAVSLALWGSAVNTVDSATETLVGLDRIGLLVQGSDPTTLPVEPLLPADLADRAKRIRGVWAVRRSQSLFSWIGDRQVLYQGVEPGSQIPAAALARAAGGRPLQPGEVALSTQLAEHLGAVPGSTVALPTAAGSRRFTVQAVVPSFLWREGLVVMPLDELETAFRRRGATVLELDVDDPGRVPTIRRSLDEAVGTSRALRLRTATGTEALALARETVSQASALLAGVGWLALGVGGLTVFNALLLSVAERRTELAIVRAVGASAGVVHRAVLLEGLGGYALAVVEGAALGLLLQYSASRLQGGPDGLPVRFAVAPGAVAGALVAALALVIIGSLVPAARATAGPVTTALAGE